jgi:dTDP-glucose 4,6-dehydratase
LKLIVTGGSGFIGSNFISLMLDRFKELIVVNVDNLSIGSNMKNLENYSKDRRYSFVRGDITDTELMRRVLEGADYLVNFAAESHVDRSIADPQPFLKSNIGGVLSILEAVRKIHGKMRIVQISTDEVYGDVEEASMNEISYLKPSSPYAATKASADLLCLAYNRTYGLDVAITRCTNNFGRFQYPEKFIPKLIIRGHLGLKLPIYGKGDNIRDWIYVTDHCNAIERVMKHGRAGQIYNIAGRNERRNIDVALAILELMGKSDHVIQHVEDRPGHDLRYSLDDSKIRSELGWRPEHQFKAALEDTVRWYLDNKKWWAEIANEDVLGPSPWKIDGRGEG